MISKKLTNGIYKTVVVLVTIHSIALSPITGTVKEIKRSVCKCKELLSIDAYEEGILTLE